MTTSERMTYLVERDVYNGSVQDAWKNFVMISMRGNCQRFLSTLRELQVNPKQKP